MPDPASSAVHRIRLQGPWEWAVPTPVSTQAWTWNRIRLPDEWDRLAPMRGAVWFRRRFNRPTGITAGDHLRVAITTQHTPSFVILNGQPLSVLSPVAEQEDSVIHYDILPQLAERNLLEIVFAHGIHPPSIDGGMGQPVVLEIESPSSNS